MKYTINTSVLSIGRLYSNYRWSGDCRGLYSLSENNNNMFFNLFARKKKKKE